MTHTIHRKCSNQDNDFLLILSSTPGVNSEGSGVKIVKLMEEILKLKPLSFGNPKDGSTLQMSSDEVVKRLKDGSRLHIVFECEKVVRKAIELIKDLDLGLSICLTGPQQKVEAICIDLGLTIDSVHFTLGILGESTITTTVEKVVSLCGHMRVSSYLVEDMIEKVRMKKHTPYEAARHIAKVCKCGAFNVNLAADIISKEANI